MKNLFYIIDTCLLILLISLILCSLHKNNQKPIYKTGKSWTVTKKADSTIHFNKAITPKPKREYYPIHHYHSDSSRWKDIVDSLKNLLAIRIYTDTQTIGKATIISYDSVQGNLLSKQIGCLYCGRDTTFINRVDTLYTQETKDSPSVTLGIQGGIYVGWNWSPIPGLYIGPGIGAGLNLKPKKTK